MALINRMSRLLTADLHAVLDRIEEPEALLRHAIREMEEALTDGERRVEALQSERQSQSARGAKVEASLRDLDGQLDLCFDSGNEALARKLVRRKLEAERFVKHAAERLESLDKELGMHRARLTDQREQLDVLRQKAELLAERTEPSATADDPVATRFAIGEDEIEVAFLRERQRRKPS
jgi:phage shock protein A